VCNPASAAGAGALSAEGTGAAGADEISGPETGPVCTATWVTGGAAATRSTPRLIRTFTSPRSNSNSAISFSIKNSMSSFSSFWFMGLRWDCLLLLLRQPERPGLVSDARAEILRTARFQIVMSSLLVGVRTSHPRSVTTTISSIRTPPLPAMYTPGSTVITIPGRRISVCPAAMRGGS
jgi:hypothetical protein